MNMSIKFYYVFIFSCLLSFFTHGQVAITPVAGSYTCTGSGTVKLRLPKGKAAYEWTNTQTASIIGADSTVTVAPGTYSARYKETALGAWVSVAAYTVSGIVPSALTVTPSSSTSGIFCGSSSVTLNASSGANYTWLRNGATTVGTGQSLEVAGNSISTGGSYSFSVRTTNATSGCSVVSNAISLTLYPSAPARPTITADAATTFCAGGSVGLSSSYTGGSNIWSRSVGGDTTTSGSNKIIVRVSNTITVVARDANGCISPVSNAISITSNPVPTAPIIAEGANISICSGDSITLNSNDKGSGSYLWNNGRTTRSIIVKTAGTYNLTFTSSAGCISPVSASTVVVVNTLPAKPTITADGALTFCEGFSVGLTSSYSGFRNVWSRSGSADTTTTGNNKIIIARSATVTVRALDANGCYSPRSNVTATTMNPRPATPIVNVVTYPENPILNDGTNIGVCSGDSVLFSSTNNNATTGTYLWNNLKTTRTQVIKTAGNYTLVYTDNLGCKSFASSPLVVTINSRPAKPTITNNTALEFCDGGSVTLTSSPAFAYAWSSGASSQSINITASGKFKVTAISDKGCKSTSPSDEVQVIVNPLPAQPTITANGPLTFCPDKSVVLSSSISETIYIWSEVETLGSSFGEARAITVNKSGSYSVQTKSAKGCVSKPSASTIITVLEAPQAPAIYALTPTNICDGGTVTLVALYANTNVVKFSWRDEATQAEYSQKDTIVVRKSGSFSVKVEDNKTCNSAYSSIQTVTINPLPQKPVITALTSKVICEGDSSILRSSLPNTLPTGRVSYRWTLNGGVLSVFTREIKAKVQGNYAVEVTDANGCKSVAFSDTVKVTVNELPATPFITLVGSNPFCADKSLTLNSSAEVGYKWSTGANTRSIAVNLPGTYTVQTINRFNCLSKPSTPIEAKTYALPNTVSILAGGNTIFCDGDSVMLSTTGNLRAYWWVNTDSLGRGDNNIWYAKKVGNYTVRVQDGNGCFSSPSTARFIDVRNTPAMPVISQVGTYTLEASGTGDANGYEWRLNNKVMSLFTKVVKVKLDANYSVRSSFTYTSVDLPDNKLVCYSKLSAVKVFQTDPTFEGLSIYPNPSSTGIVTVEVIDDLIGADLLVYDFMGRLLKEYKIEKFDTRKQINLNDYPSSSFIIKVQMDGFDKAKTVLIMR